MTAAGDPAGDQPANPSTGARLNQRPCTAGCLHNSHTARDADSNCHIRPRTGAGGRRPASASPAWRVGRPSASHQLAGPAVTNGTGGSPQPGAAGSSNRPSLASARAPAGSSRAVLARLKAELTVLATGSNMQLQSLHPKATLVLDASADLQAQV